MLYVGKLKIYKYGGSNSMIIPKRLMHELNLSVGDEIPAEINEKTGELVLKLNKRVKGK